MKFTVDINPVLEFQSELDCIKGDLHQEIFLRALQFIPSYFFITPASTSGKYHPRGDLGIGGTVRHTKAVFWLGEELLGHPSLYPNFDDTTRDDIRVALLLHDSVKLGLADEVEHTVPDHPLLVRETLRPWKDGKEVPEGMEEAWDRICNLIETHMGPWTQNKEKQEILQPPSNDAQKFVHMCDYVASRKMVEIDIIQKMPKAKYNNIATNTDWRDLPAKPAQVDYLKGLATECQRRSIDLGELAGEPLTEGSVIVIKRGRASDLIKQLKGMLGK